MVAGILIADQSLRVTFDGTQRIPKILKAVIMNVGDTSKTVSLPRPVNGELYYYFQANVIESEPYYEPMLYNFSSKSNQNNESKSKQLHVKCKRSLSVLCISIIVLMMMGCSSSTYLSPVIPANLMKPCPELKTSESGQGKSVLPWAVDIVAKYNQCSTQVDAWIEIGKALG